MAAVACSSEAALPPLSVTGASPESEVPLHLRWGPFYQRVALAARYHHRVPAAPRRRRPSVIIVRRCRPPVLAVIRLR